MKQVIKLDTAETIEAIRKHLAEKGIKISANAKLEAEYDPHEYLAGITVESDIED